MASGKSLELAAIKPKASPVCICGATYIDHMRKDGKGLLKKYADPEKHRPNTAGAVYMNRKQRRAAMRGYST